jgi:hypothetical protein
MILSAKFTPMLPDSMNFVNFAGKSLCFQAMLPALSFPPFRGDGSAR